MAEEVGGGGATILPLLALKRKKKRKEIQSALSKKDALRTGPYCLS